MANVLKDAYATPSTIRSGGTTRVTVKYDADHEGPVKIKATKGYTVVPTQTDITETGENRKIEPRLTISGPKGGCTLKFSFYGNATPARVDIT